MIDQKFLSNYYMATLLAPQDSLDRCCEGTLLAGHVQARIVLISVIGACLEPVHLHQQLTQHPLTDTCPAMLPGPAIASAGCQAVQLIKEYHSRRSSPRPASGQEHVERPCCPSFLMVWQCSIPGTGVLWEKCPRMA